MGARRGLAGEFEFHFRDRAAFERQLFVSESAERVLTRKKESNEVQKVGCRKHFSQWEQHSERFDVKVYEGLVTGVAIKLERSDILSYFVPHSSCYSVLIVSQPAHVQVMKCASLDLKVLMFFASLFNLHFEVSQVGPLPWRLTFTHALVCSSFVNVFR